MNNSKLSELAQNYNSTLKKRIIFTLNKNESLCLDSEKDKEKLTAALFSELYIELDNINKNMNEFKFIDVFDSSEISKD